MCGALNLVRNELLLTTALSVSDAIGAVTFRNNAKGLAGNFSVSEKENKSENPSGSENGRRAHVQWGEKGTPTRSDERHRCFSN